MERNAKQGLVLGCVGLVLNNFAYLSDLFFGTVPGLIWMGPKSGTLATVGAALTLLGLLRAIGKGTARRSGLGG